MTPIVRQSAFLLAVATLLGGCSFGSNSVPRTASGGGPAAGARLAIHPQPLAAAHRTNLVYSTHVALPEKNGRRRVADAIVFPERFLNGFGKSSAFRAAIAFLRKPHDPGTLEYFVYIAGVTGTNTSPAAFKGWNAVDDFAVGYGPSQGNKSQVTDLRFDRSVDAVSPYILSNLFAGTPFTGTTPAAKNQVLLDIAGDQNGSGKLVALFTFAFTVPTPVAYSSSFARAIPTENVDIQYKNATMCVLDGGKVTTCSSWNPAP
jgi:hypothetical protein